MYEKAIKKDLAQLKLRPSYNQAAGSGLTVERFEPQSRRLRGL